MWEDEIVEELRKHRNAHASKYNYDIKKIYQDLKQKERLNKTNIKVTLKPKRIVKNLV